MADLITTIKVNSNQFDNSIKESTNQIRKFKSEGDKAGKGVSDFGNKLGGVAIGGVSKIAGALGVAFTAMEAFDKMIQSTQGTADAFEIKMQQARAGVDYFFTSLSTGNWDNFFTGILKATEYAKEFAEYMDALGDVKVSTQFFSGSEQRLMTEQRAILSDPDASIEEKESALNIMESVNKRVEERARAYSDTSKSAISAKISGELNKVNSRAYDAFRDLSEEQMQEVNDIFEEINKLDIAPSLKYYKFKEELAEKELVVEDGLSTVLFKAIEKLLTGNERSINKSKSKERLENEFKNQLAKDVVDNLEDWQLPLYGIEDRNDYDPDLVLTSTFFEKALSGTDKEFMDFEKKIIDINKEIDALRVLQKHSGKTTDKYGNYLPNSSFTTEDLERLRQLEEERANLIMSDPVNNALVELKNVVVDSTNKELAQLNQDSENELTKISNNQRIINRERRRLYSESRNINKNKADEILPEGSIAYLEKRIADLNKQIKLETDPVAYKALHEEIESLQKEIVYIKVIYTTDFDPNEKISNSIKPLNAQNKYNKDGKTDVSGISIIAPDLAESMSWFDTYINALDIVRDKNKGMIESFDSISNSLSAIGDASDNSAGAMFRWLASTASAIGQAIPVIQALIMVKKAEANANAEVAATGAAASVAGTPVVGALLAVGAVATVLASISSIPKFAEGGLVYGNTIAQVGEYANASSNPEVIAPLSKLRDILSDTNEGSGQVEFKISGKDLTGVLTNYSSKQRKK